MDKARFQEMAEVTGIFNGDSLTIEEVRAYLTTDNMSAMFPGEPPRYTEAELAGFAAEVVRAWCVIE